jgi:phenylacetic acid degradation operon negative regulatory protein
VVEVDIGPELISQRAAERNVSCTSMVVTVFGDSISQHGGWIWLGSLIQALVPFGYTERLVRTAVFRLAQQDWLQIKKIGRRSYYCFTDSANHFTGKAARRIYSASTREWDGSWTLVSPVFVPEDRKGEFRKSMLWQGYHSLVNGMYAHPSSEKTSLEETLHEQNLLGKVIVFSASADDPDSQAALKTLAEQKWNLDELRGMYVDFLKFYQPLILELGKSNPGPELSFQIRTLMLHEYRRVLLRDPDFPEAMLPNGWIGFEANDLARHLYALLSKNSLDYIHKNMENAQGALPEVNAQYFKRFGGI